MTPALHSGLMWAGVVLACVPLVGHVANRTRPCRAGLVAAHLGMAACMVILAVGAGEAWAVFVVGGVAVGTARAAVGAYRAEPTALHCAIDVLAVAWIAGEAAPAHYEGTVSAGHYHLSVSGTTSVFTWLPLLIWVGATVAVYRHLGRGKADARSAGTSLLASLAMAATMAPMLG
ncbi:MAG TPA: hypothetical protein VG674_28275 [Amycolatopsis sp.]|nr:hypothetical protein [Amycolatopsis sp.]